MNINVRHCVECWEMYDIGTNFDKCPKCRNKEEVERDDWE